MAADEVRVAHDPDESQYELWLGQTRAGFLAYRRERDAVVLFHTEVDTEFEGQGLGSRLVGDALADLRNRGLQVVPVCPFVGDFLRRHPEQQNMISQHSAVRP